MNRRTFLASVGIALPALAGCLSGAGDPPGDDDGSVDTGDDGTDDSSVGGSDDSSDDGTDDSGDGGDADSVPVLTGHAVSDHVVAPDAERNSDMDAWGLFLASSDAAEEHFGAVDGNGADAVRTFVDGTAFDSGDRLLYVRAFARQTCYQLVLEDEPAVAENGRPTVRVGVDRTAPEEQVCGDAITAVDILLRLSFDPDAGSPDAVAVDVSGSLNESEELLLEAER